MVQWRNEHGTTSLAEYAITVFLVIATITAMTTYVQRTIQARMRDARHYMVKTVSDNCDDAYCGPAANLNKYMTKRGFEEQRVGDQYEPYYAQVMSVVDRNQAKEKKITASDEAAGTFRQQYMVQTTTNTFSNQAAPVYSGSDNDQVLVAQD